MQKPKEGKKPHLKKERKNKEGKKKKVKKKFRSACILLSPCAKLYCIACLNLILDQGRRVLLAALESGGADETIGKRG